LCGRHLIGLFGARALSGSRVCLPRRNLFVWTDGVLSRVFGCGMVLWKFKRVLVLLCERASSFDFGWMDGANNKLGLDDWRSGSAFSYLLNLRV